MADQADGSDEETITISWLALALQPVGQCCRFPCWRCFECGSSVAYGQTWTTATTADQRELDDDVEDMTAATAQHSRDSAPTSGPGGHHPIAQTPEAAQNEHLDDGGDQDDAAAAAWRIRLIDR